jgi:hypothetical protein
MNAGTLIIDYANPAPNNDTTGGAKFINTFPLTLGGGTMFFRFNALANRGEAVGSTTVIPGATAMQQTNGSAANTYSFAQKTITRNTGGTVNYTLAALGTGTAAFSTLNTANNGILGGWATWAGSDWAALSGANLVANAAYQTATDPTTWAATDNVSLSASPSPVPDLKFINSLKLNGAFIVTLNGSLTLSSGGLQLDHGRHPHWRQRDGSHRPPIQHRRPDHQLGSGEQRHRLVLDEVRPGQADSERLQHHDRHQLFERRHG